MSIRKKPIPSLLSKIFGKESKDLEHFIDWDISLAILNLNVKLLSQECFIFYNNHNYNDGTITLRGDSIVFYQASEFDEEVIIDFNRLPGETDCIVFYLANHQEFNFYITDINVQMENIQNISDQKFRISNFTAFNAIKLFKFQEINEIGNFEILNNSITA